MRGVLMPVKYDLNSLNPVMFECFEVVEETKKKYGLNVSRNLLYRCFNKVSKKGFSSFEKDFIRNIFAYSLFSRQRDNSLTLNETVYEDLKKEFKQEWEKVKNGQVR